MNKLSSDKTQLLEDWVSQIGYQRAMIALQKKHNTLFLDLGNEQTGLYDLLKIQKFEEIVAAIRYLKFLKINKLIK